MLLDWAVVQELFSGKIHEEYKGEHLIQFRYFSSNSCHFLKDTHLLKTQACPIGNFSCVENDGSIIEVNRTLEFTEAEEFCSNQTAHLSKTDVIRFETFMVNNEFQHLLVRSTNLKALQKICPILCFGLISTESTKHTFGVCIKTFLSSRR